MQDDDSDRDEDQDDVPSFVCQVTPGQEVESLRFDDAHDDDDAEGHASTVSRKPYFAQIFNTGLGLVEPIWVARLG